MESLKRMFEMLNYINHTPSKQGGNSTIGHKELINAVLTSPDGTKFRVGGDAKNN